VTVEISDIRTGIANNIAAVVNNATVSAYRLAAPIAPAILVTGVESIDQTSFGSTTGGYQIIIVVQALAGKPTEKGAQILLDKWLSPWGAVNVSAAIESDPTLGGKVSDVTVMTNDGTQIVALDSGTDVLASTWHVQVDL
jgi:hypothetical protein